MICNQGHRRTIEVDENYLNLFLDSEKIIIYN